MLDQTIPTPPHNEEAEQKIVATCIEVGDSSHYDDISHLVSSEDFYSLRGKLLFGAIKSICDKNEPLNEVSVMEQIKSINATNEIGGMVGLFSIMDNVTTPLDLQYCAKTVAEKARLRNVIRSCRLAREVAEEESTPSNEIKAQLEADLNADIRVDVQDYNLLSATEAINGDINAILEGGFEPDVITTNVGRLDSMLGNGGIASGEVLTLTAPTSCGKSALALNIALNSAKRQKKGVAIFSLEMPKKQITKRLLQTLSGINYKTIDETQEGRKRAEGFIKHNEELAELPIYTIHTVKSADDLAGQARSLVKKMGVKLVVIDYLQLIPFNSSRMSKAEGIASISHRIKQMALELDVAVILLAQVNREGAKREGGLSLYDLKDSGDIENDADVVLLMYPARGDTESSKGIDSRGAYTELVYKIAKNREGERDIGCIFKHYHCVGRFH
jgi:replicative DNA helicase